MNQSRFLFSLAKHGSRNKPLSSQANYPVSTNLTPIKIKVQRTSSRRRRYPRLQYLPKNASQWPQSAKCYLQIWELDRWRIRRRRDREYDAAAARTNNDLVIEIPGFIQYMGSNTFRFVAEKTVKPPAAANRRPIVLMIDTIDKNTVATKKVSIPVPGEQENCFEMGVVCETSAGQKRYTARYNYPVYFILAHDDAICYLSDRANPAQRCSTGRIHYYVETWQGHSSYGEDFYKYKYKSVTTSTFVSLGGQSSLEEMLEALKKDLDKTANKNKKIGDLVILTHGISYLGAGNQIQTVKLDLSMFGTKRGRGIPMWTLPSEIDAQEINNLLQKGSDYYTYNSKLVPVVLRGINAHVDNQTHIWLGGCTLGVNTNLLRAIRTMFGNRPTVYGFTKDHYIHVWRNNSRQVIRGREVLVVQPRRRVPVFSAEGMNYIRHVP